MTPDVLADQHATPTRGHRIRSFALHYLEMVLAMLAGMFLLGWVEGLVWPGPDLGVEFDVLVMATNMAVGMAAWMRLRGHSWRGIAEMSASMYAPFAVLLVPFWAGAIDGHALMTWGHLLMLPAMALVMVARPHEYAH